MTTVEEHVAEADRLIAQASAYPAIEMNSTTLAHRDIALARAHLHAAQTLTEIQAFKANQQVARDLKATQAYMTDRIEKMLPEEGEEERLA